MFGMLPPKREFIECMSIVADIEFAVLQKEKISRRIEATINSAIAGGRSVEHAKLMAFDLHGEAFDRSKEAVILAVERRRKYIEANREPQKKKSWWLSWRLA